MKHTRLSAVHWGERRVGERDKGLTEIWQAFMCVCVRERESAHSHSLSREKKNKKNKKNSD